MLSHFSSRLPCQDLLLRRRKQLKLVHLTTPSLRSWAMLRTLIRHPKLSSQPLQQTWLNPACPNSSKSHPKCQLSRQVSPCQRISSRFSVQTCRWVHRVDLLITLISTTRSCSWVRITTTASSLRSSSRLHHSSTRQTCKIMAVPAPSFHRSRCPRLQLSFHNRINLLSHSILPPEVRQKCQCRCPSQLKRRRMARSPQVKTHSPS